MKFLLCIPVELSLETNSRKEIRKAGAKALRVMTEDMVNTAKGFTEAALHGRFLVKTYEKTYEEKALDNAKDE